jgi:O-antigen/teichoic acid export membrane protein
MAGEALGSSRPMALMRRTGWGVADQVLSSLTNFGLSVVVARAVGPAGFGSFTLVFTSFTTALGICRAVTSEPLMVHYSTPPHQSWHSGAAKATGTALVIGVLLGFCCLLAGATVGGLSARPFLALGVTLPGLLLQDCWRYAFFARGRGFSAFANDLVCALMLLPVLLVLLRTEDASQTWLAVLGWGGAANVAALFGAYQAGLLPTPGRARRWLQAEGSLISRFLGEFAAIGGAGQLVVYVIGALAGLAALGAFRASYLLFGPIQVLYLGVSAVAVPELVRARESGGTRRLLWTSRLLSLALVAGIVIWGAVILALPESLGTALLGPVWQPARHLASAVMAGWLGTGIIAGAAAGLRSLAAAQEGLRARLIGSVLAVTGGVSGAVAGGAPGAIYGLALAAWIEASVWWWQYTRTLRRDSETAAPANLNPADRPAGAPSF